MKMPKLTADDVKSVKGDAKLNKIRNLKSAPKQGELTEEQALQMAVAGMDPNAIKRLLTPLAEWTNDDGICFTLWKDKLVGKAHTLVNVLLPMDEDGKQQLIQFFKMGNHWKEHLGGGTPPEPVKYLLTSALQRLQKIRTAAKRAKDKELASDASADSAARDSTQGGQEVAVATGTP